jgi:hypothetical protein
MAAKVIVRGFVRATIGVGIQNEAMFVMIAPILLGKKIKGARMRRDSRVDSQMLPKIVVVP